MQKNALKILFLLILLLPLWLWLGWLLQDSTELRMFILDKTVLSDDAIEHKSVNWHLTHEKFLKANGDFHDVNQDYFGFFPKANEKFDIRDLQKYTDEMLDSLSHAHDAAYIADSYGIYVNEWYRDRDLSERSRLVYGGLFSNEVKLIERMKKQGKLVVLEFNSFASPTAYRNRKKIEEMFHIQWTGWTGRHFELLDTLKNPEIPRWVIHLYKDQHQQKWPFEKAGIVLVHSSERIEILEMDTHLERATPEIRVSRDARERFDLPHQIEYPYWFDIIANSDSNKTLANYRIFSNISGDSILKHARIPKIFPAMIEHLGDYQFYYFAGDFADNPIPLWTAKLRWIEHFSFFMHNDNVSDRRRFFWKFYQPLMQRILKNYQHKFVKIKEN